MTGVGRGGSVRIESQKDISASSINSRPFKMRKDGAPSLVVLQAMCPKSGPPAQIMKANITLKLDADLLSQLRALAAKDNTSISAMLSRRLEQMVRERKSYNSARRRALVRLREGMDLRWKPAGSRDEIHER